MPGWYEDASRQCGLLPGAKRLEEGGSDPLVFDGSPVRIEPVIGEVHPASSIGDAIGREGTRSVVPHLDRRANGRPGKGATRRLADDDRGPSVGQRHHGELLPGAAPLKQPRRQHRHGDPPGQTIRAATLHYTSPLMPSSHIGTGEKPAAVPRAREPHALDGPLGLVAILATASVVSATAYVRGRIPWNSDMAMVGLTARDILRRGVHPVFFEGSDYAGTLEQHWVALWFRLLGDSIPVHRLAIAILLLGIIALVWALTRVAFGARPALWAGAYLALAPPYFFHKGLTSDGPYTPIYLLGAAILLLILLAERRAEADRDVGVHVAAIGLLGGLAWWTHPLALVWGGCALVALAVGRVRRRLTLRSIAAALVAFFIGSAPWWMANLESGWRSIFGPEAGRATLGAALSDLKRLVDTGVPVLMGTRTIGAAMPLFPGGAALAWLLLGACASWGAWLAVRADSPHVRFGARLLLPLFLLCPAFGLLSYRANFSEPRLAFPFYFAIAPLAGAAMASRTIPRRGRIVGALSILALHAFAHARAPRRVPPPAALLQELRSSGVTAVYASYWDAYRIDFLGDGSVTATPFGEDAATRRPRESALVDAAADPAFLLQTEEARRMKTRLDAAGIRYRVDSLADRTLFRELPPLALRQMRRCLCIPDRLVVDPN